MKSNSALAFLKQIYVHKSIIVYYILQDIHTVHFLFFVNILLYASEKFFKKRIIEGFEVFIRMLAKQIL